MPTYPLIRRAGHLIVDRGAGLELLDTGSPLTMPLPEVAQRVVGSDVRTLLGTDQLGEVPFCLDLRADTIEFGTELTPGPNATRHPLQLMMGIPVLGITTSAGAREAFFDTGAPIGYGAPDDLDRHPMVDERSDFHPAIGTFTTPIYEVPITIGQRTVTVEVGTLPPLLGGLMGLTGATWIVGPSAFEGRRVVVDLAAEEPVLWDADAEGR